MQLLLSISQKMDEFGYRKREIYIKMKIMAFKFASNIDYVKICVLKSSFAECNVN